LQNEGIARRKFSLVVGFVRGLYPVLTQKKIADHLDLSQQAVSALLEKLGLDPKVATLDEVRIAYIRNLRAVASGHRSDDGMDLTRERVLTERVDRELKQLTVAEKKGLLINVSQLEPELVNMVGAFRTELLARDDKLKADLDALHSIDVDLAILNEHTNAALSQLARYDAGSKGFGVAPGSHSGTAGEADND
jgi:hypothetical protein